jgi:outer membrane protein assembly factor BamB
MNSFVHQIGVSRLCWGIVWWAFCSGVCSAEWAQWRGPHGDGISSEKNPPLKWSGTENVVWKAAIPGEGHSSVVIWKEAMFVTTALRDSGERILLRLNAETGEILWRRTVLTAPIEHMHWQNSPASSTPVTDGKHVYTSFQNGKRVDLRCFDFDGNEIWAVQPLSFEGEHGYSYTPLLYRDVLIVDFAQEGEAATLGLDARTGEIRWRADRIRRRISHVTPLLVEAAGKIQVIVCGSNEIRGLNPLTGETYWFAEGPTDVCVAGLSFGEGMVFATGGFPLATRMAVDVSGAGDVTETHVRWSIRRAVSYVPSPVYHEGYLYTMLDQGLLNCFDVKSGEASWGGERVGGRHRSSLVLADGLIYATDDEGRTTIFRANPETFEQVAVNELGEFCYTTPAIVNGRIYFRTKNHVLCIGNGGAGE